MKDFIKLWKLTYKSYLKTPYWIKQLNFLKVLNSPFKRLTLTWYFGEIKYGTPYFLPRKWVKMTQKDCEESLQNDLNNATKNGWYYNKERTWEYYKNNLKPIPIKYFGFHFTSLGWKTKWNEYRFEWSPSISIIIFGKQLFISILPKIQKYQMFNRDYLKVDCYWESWLNWEYNTDKFLSFEERFKELISEHSNTWISGTKDNEIVIDYYPIILKNKYLKLYEKIMEERKSLS